MKKQPLILATLLAGSKPVRADAVAGLLPELDRLAVQAIRVFESERGI